ncbi:MAG: PD40 domain-containing protein [Saprospiraceae bacterium]|nr:PD40 domain-containing protein [Saprospiraceae bacterium]
MKKNLFLFICCMFFFILPGNAQRSFKKLANQYFEAGKYRDAAYFFEKYKNTEKQTTSVIRRGISYYYTNNPDACIRDMETAKALKTRDNRIYKYAGLSYFDKMNYSEAAGFFKTYLRYLKNGSREWFETIDLIKRCESAMQMRHEPQMAFVENAGLGINSIFDDFAPIFSPTRQNRIYFSSAREGVTGGLRNKKGLEDQIKGHYYADMFYVDNEEGLWSGVSKFQPLLNTPKHDVILHFNNDGSVMYFLRSSDLKTGVIYSDTFDIDKIPSDTLQRALLPISAEYGDKDLFIFSDSLIMFSAIRPEGYGGYDLYFVEKKGFTWQNPVNLGPGINTPYNEISPFITKSGDRIYFSSDRLEGIGGYDVYQADFDTERSRWLPVKNMAIPINSSKDDEGFYLTSDGVSAVFSSNRLGSLGGKDLYFAYFKNQDIEQLQYTEVPAFTSRENFADQEFVNDPSPTIIQNEKAVIRSDFFMSPLYYKENEDILTPNNNVLIKRLSELLQIYPEIEVILTGHTVQEGNSDLDVYFTMKLTEKISNRLVNSGVQPGRIHIQSCGSYYPLATPYINGIKSTLAAKVNRRIDISLVNVNPERVHVIYEYPSVENEFRDYKWDGFQKLNDTVTFRVQFAKTAQLFKSDFSDSESEILMYKKANQSDYIYTYGNTMSYSEAKELKNKLAKIYTNADISILAYYKGLPLDRIKMVSLSESIPALGDFLREN